jgi:phage-related protein
MTEVRPARARRTKSAPYRLEFYEDPDGNQPVRHWLRYEISPVDRRTIGAAMRQILQQQGISVCGTSFGRQLGSGLFEFRVREDQLVVRIFCHAYGDRLILLLAGYNKGRSPSERLQHTEIALARARLREWLSRHGH